MHTAPSPLAWQILRIVQETPDIRTFRLEIPPGTAFSFLPGQHIIVTASLWSPKRQKPVPVHRAFSISSSPLEVEAGYIEFSARRYPGGRMTAWLHGEVREGDTLRVAGPYGEFVLREEEWDEVVLVAGGIGVAPFRSMIRYIFGKGLPISVHLYYSARTPEDFAFRDEWDHLAQVHPHQFQVVYTVTRDPEGWPGRMGRIQAAWLEPFVTRSRTGFFLCGPEALIEDLSRDLERMGVAPERIRWEKW